MPNDYQKEIIADVMAERDFQDSKWGGPEHDAAHHPHDWNAFIVHYLGKAMGAVEASDPAEYSTNMVKVAALSLAALEFTGGYRHDV